MLNKAQWIVVHRIASIEKSMENIMDPLNNSSGTVSLVFANQCGTKSGP